MRHAVWITGFGLVSRLGSDPGDLWRRLNQPASDGAVQLADAGVSGFDVETAVPRKHRRYMGPLMWYGVAAAAQALEAAGVRDDELRARIAMMVTCSGGERDEDADESLFAALLHEPAASVQARLNALLAEKLRPSLFLAQLPNLLASNIAMVSALTGPSRTFIGEESAGFECLRLAIDRLRAGQGEIFLVGGACNGASNPGRLGLHAHGMLAESYEELWSAPQGVVPGSGAAFLVLETAEHARRRGATPRAVLRGACSTVSDRGDPESVRRNGELLRAWVLERTAHGHFGMLSGASGERRATAIERDFIDSLRAHRRLPHVRATARYLGHLVEAAPFVNTCLAALCIERGSMFAPLRPLSPFETNGSGSEVDGVIVTSFGMNACEGVLMVEAA